jgi:hypothetical protein
LRGIPPKSLRKSLSSQVLGGVDRGQRGVPLPPSNFNFFQDIKNERVEVFFLCPLE